LSGKKRAQHSCFPGQKLNLPGLVSPPCTSENPLHRRGGRPPQRSDGVGSIQGKLSLFETHPWPSAIPGESFSSSCCASRAGMGGSSENTFGIGYDWRAEVPRRPSLESFVSGSQGDSGHTLAPPASHFLLRVESTSRPGWLQRQGDQKCRPTKQATSRRIPSSKILAGLVVSRNFR